MKKTIIFALSVLTILLSGEEIRINPDGSFSICGQHFQITHYNSTWKAAVQSEKNVMPEKGYPKYENGAFSLNAAIRTSAEPFHFFQESKRLAEREIISSYKLPKTSRNSQVVLETVFPLPAGESLDLELDKKTLVIPKESDEKKIMFIRTPKILNVFQSQGFFQFSGFSRCLIQDDRRWNFNRVRIRFSGKDTENGQLLHFRAKYIPYTHTFADFSGAANMGLIDEIAGDGKGGWTDQGPENDMRSLKPGIISKDTIPFRVGTGNDEKCILALHGSERPNFPKQISVEIAETVPATRNLYILNAVAWEKKGADAGKLSVHYRDGSISIHRFLCGENTANFWGWKKIPNARLVWKNENDSSKIGLYSTRIPLKRIPVRRLVFQSGKGPVWLIPGATFSDSDFPPKNTGHSSKITARANNEWRKITDDHTVEKNSILDLSGTLDAPAGKYGRLKVDGSQFVFEKRLQIPVKFWGTNFCFGAAVPPRKYAPLLAEHAARNGYNCVRLHHFDHMISNSKDGKGAVTLIPERIDEMDFLVSELKKRGIYITLDLYTLRKIPAGGIPGFPELSGGTLKQLCLIHEPAMDNIRQFAKNLLEHVNP